MLFTLSFGSKVGGLPISEKQVAIKDKQKKNANNFFIILYKLNFSWFYSTTIPKAAIFQEEPIYIFSNTAPKKPSFSSILGSQEIDFFNCSGYFFKK